MGLGHCLITDTELIEWLQSVARCDPKMDGQHVWWPLHWNINQTIRGPTLREALINAYNADKLRCQGT